MAVRVLKDMGDKDPVVKETREMILEAAKRNILPETVQNYSIRLDQLLKDRALQKKLQKDYTAQYQKTVIDVLTEGW